MIINPVGNVSTVTDSIASLVPTIGHPQARLMGQHPLVKVLGHAYRSNSSNMLASST